MKGGVAIWLNEKLRPATGASARLMFAWLVFFLVRPGLRTASVWPFSLAPHAAPGRRAPKIRGGACTLYRGVWGFWVGTALLGGARLRSWITEEVRMVNELGRASSRSNV